MLFSTSGADAVDNGSTANNKPVIFSDMLAYFMQLIALHMNQFSASCTLQMKMVFASNTYRILINKTVRVCGFKTADNAVFPQSGDLSVYGAFSRTGFLAGQGLDDFFHGVVPVLMRNKKIQNLFLDFDKTWKRKWEEALYTIRIEASYSKDEILEGYLNTKNYGIPQNRERCWMFARLGGLPNNFSMIPPTMTAPMTAS